ncbi:hypothetical protein F7725_025924 [Dissostichus mawsoni]|uniref:Uncharacterized protein n=1 Tax=Dissostichus mawsoni TaxID=36200 RepID=A0A7J5X6I7_DISMA|nr:hypothetical protein F7725_025924 [Dissostichus mawsoni]
MKSGVMGVGSPSGLGGGETKPRQMWRSRALLVVVPASWSLRYTGSPTPGPQVQLRVVVLQNQHHEAPEHTVLTLLQQRPPDPGSPCPRRGEGVQVLPPEGEELLDAEASQRVVPGVTDPVLLTHGHQLVVDVQSVLWGGDTWETNMEGKWSGVMETYDSSARTSIARGPIRFRALTSSRWRCGSLGMCFFIQAQQWTCWSHAGVDDVSHGDVQASPEEFIPASTKYPEIPGVSPIRQRMSGVKDSGQFTS